MNGTNLARIGKMTEYSNTNKLVAFKNTRKKDPKHADFEGTLNVEGVDYWLNIWKRESSSPDPDTGKPKVFLSGTIKQKAMTPKQAVGDDDIPF